MINKPFGRIVLAMACLVSSLACAFGGLFAQKAGPEAEAESQSAGDQEANIFLLGDAVSYPGLGFSFRRPLAAKVTPANNGVDLRDDELGLDIYLYSHFSDDSGDLDGALGSWLGSMRADFPSIQTDDPEPVTVGGVDARMVQLGVDEPGNTFSGFLVVAPLNAHRMFYFAFYAPSQMGSVEWEYHRDLARQFLQGIELFAPDNTACAVSADDGFGYLAENPVLIGESVSGGYGRAISFMQNLVARDGNPFLYEYKTMTTENERSIYIFRVFVDSPEERELFLALADPRSEEIPQGFICAAGLESIW